MYKQYAHSNSFRDSIAAGTTASEWSNVWSRRQLSRERSVAKLAKAPQWKAMVPFVIKGMTVLEAGCGLGSWVRFFKARGLDPVGIDFSLSTIERLKEAFTELCWIAGNVTELPFADNCFDLLVSWGVVEHFEAGPMDALREMRRVVQPGGYAFFTVPWLSPYRLRHGYDENGNNLHLFPSNADARFAQYFMTEEEILGFVSSAGFTPVKVLPSSLHAKSILPPDFRRTFPLTTRIFNRLMSPVLPNSLIASMLLVVAVK